MLKLKSENNFLKFLRTQGKGQALALVICIGIGLLLLGGGVNRSDEAPAATLEDDTEALCSMVSGVGECRVMITYTEEERVYAVAVLCDGAESDTVRREIVSLVCSLFGIGSNRVSVLKLSK